MLSGGSLPQLAVARVPPLLHTTGRAFMHVLTFLLPEAAARSLAAVSTAPSNSSTLVAILGTGLSAPLLLTYLLRRFEKTHAVEISYFSLFLCALNFEGVRLFLPILYTGTLTTYAGNVPMQIVMFFRSLALLAFFASGIFAKKTLTRQEGAVVFVLCTVAFLISRYTTIHTIHAYRPSQSTQGAILLAQPISESGSIIDSTGEEKTLKVRSSAHRKTRILVTPQRNFTFYYGSHAWHRWFFWTTAVLSALSYGVLGHTLQISHYYIAAAALPFVIAGYRLLTHGLTWSACIVGLFLLNTASVFFIRSVHRVHIWQ